ncbi:hypothetical protein FOCG_17418 [Fusarium oxysporum f. sp. radicis-lycopersici 26381]|nr:hypothetical protein FOCG_17418 [Fusarium oxysporum f. sp. radicis-lycopersici 26381]
MSDIKRLSPAPIRRTLKCSRMVVTQGPFYDRIPMSDAHKRRRPPPPTDIANHSKKRKLDHPAFPPASFWDNLSEKHLTRNALRELDRRNAGVAKNSARTRNHFAPRVTARIERSQPIDQFLDQCSPECLHQIEQLAEEGGPDLRDLRGPAARDELESFEPRSSKTGFAVSFKEQCHVGHHNGQERPGNLEEIRQALGQPRRSLSPSVLPDDQFEAFQRADAHASKESQVIIDVIPMIEGNVGDRKCAARQVPFTNLDHLTDGTLVPGNPDLYYGARPEQLDQKVRQELGGHIIPSTQHDLPIVPNFFLEVKGPDGSAAVAKRQLLYDMALGATGYDAIRSYKADAATYDNKAYTIGCTYQDGQLKMYASHPIEPFIPENKHGIAMTQLKAFALTNDPDTFRQGATAYRNGRDWAKLQRDQVIAQANERIGLGSLESPQSEVLGVSFASDASCVTIEVMDQKTTTNSDPHAVPSLYESDTSADELSLDFQPPIKRSRSLQKRSCSAQDQSQLEKGDGTSKNPFKAGKDFHLLLGNHTGSM